MKGVVRTQLEVDPAQEPVRIPQPLLHEILSHAREAAPEECCGLVVGDAERRFREVHRCRNDVNVHHQGDPGRWPRDATRAFHMNEQDYLRVAREAEAGGRFVTAIYHSHPGAGAWFSDLDQEFAAGELFPFPEADHIVVSVVDGKLGQALFRRVPTAPGFVGHPLEPELA